MDLPRLTPSELQHWDSSLKSTDGIWGGTKVSGIRVRSGGQLSQMRKVGRGHGSFSEPSPKRATEPAVKGQSKTPSIWLTWFVPPWGIPEAPLTQPMANTNCYQWLCHMNVWPQLGVRIFLNLLKQVKSCLNESLAAVALLGLRSSTSSSQLWITIWLTWNH